MFQEEKGRPSSVETKHSHPGETVILTGKWLSWVWERGARERLEKRQNTGGHKVGQSLREKDLNSAQAGL